MNSDYYKLIKTLEATYGENLVIAHCGNDKYVSVTSYDEQRIKLLASILDEICFSYRGLYDPRRNPLHHYFRFEIAKYEAYKEKLSSRGYFSILFSSIGYIMDDGKEKLN